MVNYLFELKKYKSSEILDLFRKMVMVTAILYY